MIVIFFTTWNSNVLDEFHFQYGLDGMFIVIAMGIT